MIKVMVLVEDYWHHRDSIEPFVKAAFPSDKYDAAVTESPDEALAAMDGLDLFVSFKNPIENDQIPTPIWLDERFTDKLFERVGGGMGFICCHAGLTDMPDDHRVYRELTQSKFLMHPPQCPVGFRPCGKHEVFDGVGTFSFPEIDEHYVMEMLPDAPEVLAVMTSEHGEQPALWLKEYKKGRVVCLTPAHNAANLTCPEYLRLFGNVIKWCLG